MTSAITKTSFWKSTRRCPPTRDHIVNLQRIEQLVNPAENKISENISRIRKKFIEAVGEQMTEDYVISGQRAGVRKIKLDRSLVVER